MKHTARVVLNAFDLTEAMQNAITAKQPKAYQVANAGIVVGKKSESKCHSDHTLSARRAVPVESHDLVKLGTQEPSLAYLLTECG